MRSNQKKVIIKMEIENDDGAKQLAQSGKIGCDKVVAEGNGEKLSVVVEGMLKLKDGRIELKYIEPEKFDMEHQVTLLSFDPSAPEVLMLTRRGVCTTVFVFEQGKRYVCQYSAFGVELDFVTNTLNLSNNITFENGGDLRLCYTLENGGMTVSTVRMSLNVTPDTI